MIDKSWYFILSCIIVSLIVGTLFIPHFTLDNYDSLAYIDVAENIAKGKGFAHDSPYIDENGLVKNMPLIAWLPLYQFITSFFIRFSIEPVLASRIVNLIFTGLTIIPIYFLTRDLYGKKIAYVTCIIITIFYPFVANQIATMTETLYIFFLVTSIYFLNAGKHKRNFILSGIFAGLTYLTKGIGVILLFTIIIYILIFYKKKIKHIFLTSFGFFITTLPWWIRNFIVVHNPFYYSQARLIDLGTENILSNILAVKNIFFDLFPISLFFVFSIFSLKEDKKKFFLLFLYPIFHISFFSGWTLMGQYTRLFSHIYIFLIILSVKGFFDLIKYLKNVIKIENLEKISIVIFLIAVAIPNLYNIYILYSETKNPEDNFIYKLGSSSGVNYIKEDTKEDDLIMVFPTSFFGPDGVLHFHTGRPIISSTRHAYFYEVKVLPIKFSVLRFSSPNYGSPEFMDDLKKLNVQYVYLFKGEENVRLFERKTENINFILNLMNDSIAPSNFEVVYNKPDAIIYKVH